MSLLICRIMTPDLYDQHKETDPSARTSKRSSRRAAAGLSMTTRPLGSLPIPTQAVRRRHLVCPHNLNRLRCRPTDLADRRPQNADLGMSAALPVSARWAHANIFAAAPLRGEGRGDFRKRQTCISPSCGPGLGYVGSQSEREAARRKLQRCPGIRNNTCL